MWWYDWRLMHAAVQTLLSQAVLDVPKAFRQCGNPPGTEEARTSGPGRSAAVATPQPPLPASVLIW